MEIIEFLLALVGLVALIVVCGFALALWLTGQVEPAEAPPHDGLGAVDRITAEAWDAAQAIRAIREASKR